MGWTQRGDLADPPGQGQERYSKATGPSRERLHRGTCQTSPGAMEATCDRQGRYRVQEGVACQAEWPRNSNHKSEAVVP